jgi:hypothetical protein
MIANVGASTKERKLEPTQLMPTVHAPAIPAERFSGRFL